MRWIAGPAGQQKAAAANDLRPDDLDPLNRPRFYADQLVHHGCTRNEYYEFKASAEKPSDLGCMMENLERWLHRYERGLIDRRAFLAGVAMAAGASAEEAVRLAIERWADCGGDVTVLTLPRPAIRAVNF